MFKMIMIVFVFGVVIVFIYVIVVDNLVGGVINFIGVIIDIICMINGGKSVDMIVVFFFILVKDVGIMVGLIIKNKKFILLIFFGCMLVVGMIGMLLKVYFFSVDNIFIDGKYLLNNSVNENDVSVVCNVGFVLVESGKFMLVMLNQVYIISIMGILVVLDLEMLMLDVYYYKINVVVVMVGVLSFNVIYIIFYL